MASSIYVISAAVSVTCSAPSDSLSCARVRAPISGTIVEPFARTQAMANCEALAPLSAAGFCTVSITL